MHNNDKIPTLLSQMSDLLSRFGPQSWADALKQCASEYQTDPNGTVARIRRLYGGMGSLNDIVLYDADGRLMQNENNTFDELRARLYAECR